MKNNEIFNLIVSIALLILEIVGCSILLLLNEAKSAEKAKKYKQQKEGDDNNGKTI